MFRRLISFPLGTYPTPVERVAALESGRSAFWVKRDDLTHPELGGNKVRKLEHPLADALKRGAKRIVTVGAVGSHHVLATALFGQRAELSVDAVLVPQPRTPTAEPNLRVGLAHGLHVHEAKTMATAFASTLARGIFGDHVYVIPVGGSSVLGTLGYVDAGRELAHQVATGELPKPDLVVVTVGSGGTAAGLALGFAAAGLETKILGVCVSDPALVVQGLVHALIVATAPVVGGASPSRLAYEARRRLSMTTDYLGRGYAYPTERGEAAMARGRDAGITLDPTYTAKTFAGALDVLASARHQNVLYWQTLSTRPLEPLLRDAPETPPRLARLFR